jgi:hypothetical protein
MLRHPDLSHPRKILRRTVMSRTVSVVALSVLLGSAAFAADTPTAAAVPKPNRNAVLVVGAGSAKHNTRGSLSSSADGVSFDIAGKSYKVSKTSLQKVTVGSDERETGGLPVTAAKAAIPYAGGRVISLFTHEKFDTLTLEYRDENGGYNGAVFRLPKGQAEALATAAGEITVAAASKPMASTDKSDVSGWAIQVEPLNPGETAISQSFLVATYEYLLQQLQKSHKFVAVIRSGDVNAAKYPKLLVLKTDVLNFVRGNEQARAVTTVKGWGKLRVKMDLSTSDGRSITQKELQSNVRFYGSNMRATETLAHSMGNLASTAQIPQ